MSHIVIIKNKINFKGLWDKLVFNKTKEAFGGRVRFMVSASAPISAEILDFLKVVVCCPIVEAYG